MDFSLSEEQVLLQDSVARFVREQASVDRHRKLAASEIGFDPKAWQQFCELGWLCVPFTEEQGGIGGSAVDLMVMGEALGRGLVREPYLHTAVCCGSLLQAGSAELQATYIPSIIDGSAQWAFAFAEAGSGYDWGRNVTTAQVGADGYLLSGEKIAVLNGHCADSLIVTARLAGRDGISLFVVDASSAGVSRVPFTAVDGSRGAHIRFDAVAVSKDSLLGAAGAGEALIERAMRRIIVAMGAEALGAMQVLLNTTVEYTQTREQFGQPIGRFQALQHRMADMYLKVEETRSLLLDAAIQVDNDSAQSAAACAALKVKISEAGRFVSQQAVQLHGGIGMTDELVVGHHFKRLLLLGMLFGDESYYLDRYISLTA